jgi:hypothetical protein
MKHLELVDRKGMWIFLIQPVERKRKIPLHFVLTPNTMRTPDTVAALEETDTAFGPEARGKYLPSTSDIYSA